MKAFKLIGGCAAAALFLLTSCLGEGSNTRSNTTFVVGATSDKTFKTVLNTPVTPPIYSASLASKVVDGACYLATYEIDLDSPDNANADVNGYYTAAITILQEIDKGSSVFYNVPDTAKLLENEIALTNAGFFPQYGAYVDGNLFMGGTYNGFKDQRNSWTLYWDRSVEPTNVEGVPTYSLFLRATKAMEGTGSTSTSMEEVRAYNVKAVLESVNKAEVAKGSTKFNLKINFLNSINEKDLTDLTWKSYMINFEVSKES